MRIHTLAALALLLLAASVSRAGEEEPSLADVREALEDYLPDAKGARGEARIKAWGDKALPHLEAIAQAGGFGKSRNVADATREIATPKAIELYVRILEDKTGMAGMFALMNLYPYASRWHENLREHPRFKAAVLRHASSLLRGRVAAAIGEMGWKDQLPLLRMMLKDHDLDVRKSAVDAIHRLTGERVEIERPKVAVPGKRLVPGLLATPEALPTQGRRRPDLVRAMPWLDGTPRLVCGFEDGFSRPGDRAELRVSAGLAGEPLLWPLPLEVDAVLVGPTPDGKKQLLALASEKTERRFTTKVVIAWTPEGKLRWRRQFGQRFLKDLALLHGEEGPIGVAVGAGGKDGIIALDFEGKTIWQVPRRHVVRQVKSHRSLPGFLLHVGGGATIYEHSSDSVSVHFQTTFALNMHVASGELFPDAERRPSIVLAGEQLGDSVPTVVRLDERGAQMWKVQLPDEIEKLALLEVPGAPRLFILTTERGDMFVLDENGVLRWRARFPGAAEEKERIATYELAAGEIAPRVYAVLVTLLRDAYLYRVNVDALRRAK